MREGNGVRAGFCRGFAWLLTFIEKEKEEREMINRSCKEIDGYSEVPRWPL